MPKAQEVTVSRHALGMWLAQAGMTHAYETLSRTPSWRAPVHAWVRVRQQAYRTVECKVEHHTPVVQDRVPHVAQLCSQRPAVPSC